MRLQGGRDFFFVIIKKKKRVFFRLFCVGFNWDCLRKRFQKAEEERRGNLSLERKLMACKKNAQCLVPFFPFLPRSTGNTIGGGGGSEGAYVPSFALSHWALRRILATSIINQVDAQSLSSSAAAADDDLSLLSFYLNSCFFVSTWFVWTFVPLAAFERGIRPSLFSALLAASFVSPPLFFCFSLSLRRCQQTFRIHRVNNRKKGEEEEEALRRLSIISSNAHTDNAL